MGDGRERLEGLDWRVREGGTMGGTESGMRRETGIGGVLKGRWRGSSFFMFVICKSLVHQISTQYGEKSCVELECGSLEGQRAVLERQGRQSGLERGSEVDRFTPQL